MDNPKRARSWKRRIQPRVDLRVVEPVLYSTRKFPPLAFVMDLTGYAESINHDEISAGRRAVEFAQVAFVKGAVGVRPDNLDKS